MPTLFARRYMRKLEHVSHTEKVLGVFILLLIVGVVVLFVVQVATNKDYLFSVAEDAYAPATPEVGAPETATASEAATPGPFPDIGVEGWRPPVAVERYTPEDLYIKIDGQAPAYVHYGVVGLTFGTYTRADDAERTLDVYWYDMGTADNALKMYQAEEAPEATPVSFGKAGYQVGGAVFFCKGSSYVQVIPSSLNAADAEAALRVAQRVAERIEP